MDAKAFYWKCNKGVIFQIFTIPSAVRMYNLQKVLTEVNMYVLQHNAVKAVSLRYLSPR
jgi:hypothetical protein